MCSLIVETFDRLLADNVIWQWVQGRSSDGASCTPHGGPSLGTVQTIDLQIELLPTGTATELVQSGVDFLDGLAVGTACDVSWVADEARFELRVRRY